MQVFEDGFALLITDETWRRVRHALASAAELDIPLAGGGAFEIRWRA